jgi:hypothetical protein
MMANSESEERQIALAIYTNISPVRCPLDCAVMGHIHRLPQNYIRFSNSSYPPDFLGLPGQF